MRPNHARTGLTIAIVLLAALVPAAAQQTVGLFVNDSPQDGYTLFSPNARGEVYLINNDGLAVHSWSSSYRPGMMAYLLDNGHLLRSAMLPAPNPTFGMPAGRGGRLEQFDWDGNLVWELTWSDADRLSHHDIEPLPNGNVLLISFDYLTTAEAIASGRNPAYATFGVWLESIYEIEPVRPAGGNVVWEWHARDHLIQDYDPFRDNYGVVADHPGLIDFNFNGQVDFLHMNGIEYIEEFDQVILSPRAFSEIWIIDHSTTTTEAAGHTGGNSGRGGDILYRWGNAAAYDRGTFDDQRLYGQHDPTWIPGDAPQDGTILIFSNGQSRPQGLYSTLEEIAPPVDGSGAYTAPAPGEPYAPADPLWIYQADPPQDFFSANQAGAQRQPNGNTLVCETTTGRLFEVDATGSVVWQYVSPVNGGGPVTQGGAPGNNGVFKVRRYPPYFPGLTGRDLIPGDPVEDFTSPRPPASGSLQADRVAGDGSSIDVTWDPFSCPAFDYNLLYGSLESVGSYQLAGADCGLGITGGHLWTGVPAADLYFLVVGTDETGIYESGWGRSTKASFRCGATTQVVTASCP